MSAVSFPSFGADFAALRPAQDRTKTVFHNRRLALIASTHRTHGHIHTDTFRRHLGLHRGAVHLPPLIAVTSVRSIITQ